METLLDVYEIVGRDCSDPAQDGLVLAGGLWREQKTLQIWHGRFDRSNVSKCGVVINF